MNEYVVIWHDGCLYVFPNILEAQAAIRACDPEFENVELDIHGEKVIDKSSGQTVGRFVNVARLCNEVSNILESSSNIRDVVELILADDPAISAEKIAEIISETRETKI